MKASSCPLLFFLVISSFSVSRGQERAPHGLAYESPIAFSPAAYDFFHPNAHPSTCDDCSPYPLAAQVRASEAQQLQVTKRGEMGAGGVVGIVVGIVLAVLLAMGVYYIAVTRRLNLKRANDSAAVEPNV
ncbi:hypothetical protein Ancab_010678 [Ancistrocladus abbreviatus]